MPNIGLLLGDQLSWSISLMAVLICLAACYTFSIKCYAKLGIVSIPSFLFLLGLLLFYFTVGSPFAVISHLSFSLHMIQMSILYFIIPPLVLLGIPEQLFVKALAVPMLTWIKRFRFPPKIALYIFAVFLLLYHMPFILTFLTKIPLLQNGYISGLFLLSFIIWWPIASPDPDQRLGRYEIEAVCNEKWLCLAAGVPLFHSGCFYRGNRKSFIRAADRPSL